MQSIDGPAEAVHASSDRFRPSEYTALLIQALRADPAAIAGISVLEIGFGSGVILGALGGLGAAHLCGVDIEAQAVGAASGLLADLGLGAIAELFAGDMWSPVARRSFDLVVANLPHFPSDHGVPAGRLPTWSCGGPDGRRFLDRFIAGVGAHLEPDGRALLTHNAFVDIDRSRELAARSALDLRIVLPSLVYIPDGKLRSMTGSVRQAQQGRTIHSYGPYSFGEMCIVELRRSESRI